MGAYEFQGLILVGLDIKPGSCPNPVNVHSRGVVPMAIVGSESFDVREIEADSLVLVRTDGVGGAVPPVVHGRGTRVKVEDVATPFGGELCDCHDLGSDGIDDLVLKFSTRKTARALELDSAPHNTSVTLTVSGSLFDGTEFEGTDSICVVP